MSETVVLDGVTKRFGDVTAVRNASLRVGSGEIFGILGPSGAGKSTVLRLIDMLEPADQGRISILNTPVPSTPKAAHAVRCRIGMVLQKPVVLNRSVANNLAYSLRIRGWKEQATAEKVKSELKRLGLEDRSGKNARTLSGGEMQRLSFSRATIFNPDILLLDEFAANLDPSNVGLMEKMVREYIAEGSSRSVVLVTHNIFQAKRMCDTIALMWDGEVVEVAPKTKFFEDPEDERTDAFVKGEAVY